MAEHQADATSGDNAAKSKSVDDVLPAPAVGESTVDHIYRVLRELARHFLNLQLDVDWARDLLAMLRDGVQNSLAATQKRDADTTWLIANTAKMNERIRWIVLLMLPGTLLWMFVGFVVAARLTVGLIGATFEMLEGKAQADAPAACGCEPATTASTLLLWHEQPDQSEARGPVR